VELLPDKIYPYPLRGMEAVRPNQVWAMDITYIPMAKGFVYLAAVLDWFSRRVLSWRVSITMEATFCVKALEDALAKHGKPLIFNTDQGSQFTGTAFTGVLYGRSVLFRDWFNMPSVRRSHEIAMMNIQRQEAACWFGNAVFASETLPRQQRPL
jgi:transposase InsO family protein